MTELVHISKVSTVEIILALIRDVAAEWGRSVSYKEVWLAFLEAGKLMWEFIPSIRDVDFDKEFNKGSLENEGRVQRFFLIDRFGYSGGNWNSFIQVSGGGKESGSIWILEPLLLFRINVTESHEIREYRALRYIEVEGPIYTGREN